MKKEDINKILVLGAGVMGHGIAQLFAQHDYSVTLVDTSQEVLDKAYSRIKESLEALVRLSEMPEEKPADIMGRIEMTTDLETAAADVDMVMEAVPEVEEIKEKVYKTLDKVCRKDVIFASNTSGLEIFSFVDVSNPARFLAAHFFAPAQIIPLVEVCPGPDTDPEILDTVTEILKDLGKEPVVLEEFVPSYIVNRIQNYIAMAVFEILNNDWATPEQIDKAVKASLGVRLPVVGVVQTMDFNGLDLVNDIMKSKGVTMPIIDDKVKKGHLGIKTSKGFFDYGGKPEAEMSEIRDRHYLQMINNLKNINGYEPL